MKIDELFKSFLDEIEQAVSINVFNLWFSKIEPVSLSETMLKIKVPMQIHKNMLSNNYKDIINSTLYTITGKNYEIEYITEDELIEEQKSNEIEVTTITNEINHYDEEWETNLNSKYTFESFVVGDSNRLAVVSAHAVAENPGTIHNPLFLYGKSGIGKTHLMHAIGNYIVQHSNKKVLYITSNDFVADYTGFASIEKGVDSIEYAKNIICITH